MHYVSALAHFLRFAHLSPRLRADHVFLVCARLTLGGMCGPRQGLSRRSPAVSGAVGAGLCLGRLRGPSLVLSVVRGLGPARELGADHSGRGSLSPQVSWRRVTLRREHTPLAGRGAGAGPGGAPSGAQRRPPASPEHFPSRWTSSWAPGPMGGTGRWEPAQLLRSALRGHWLLRVNPEGKGRP